MFDNPTKKELEEEAKKYKYRAKVPKLEHKLSHAFLFEKRGAHAQQLQNNLIQIKHRRLGREQPPASAPPARSSSRCTSRSSSRSTFRSGKYNRFPREYRDSRGALKRRGQRTKQLQFELFLPFEVRQEEPWWFDPTDGVEEGDDGSGILMDIQADTGAQISVPESSKDPIVVSCEKSEKRALAACREILNAALEHQNVQVVPGRIVSAARVDGSAQVTETPFIDPEDDEILAQWPECGSSVRGNFFATGGSIKSPVLFAPATEIGDNQGARLDYRAYCAELPPDKLPEAQVIRVHAKVRNQIIREGSDGTNVAAIRGGMWRIGPSSIGKHTAGAVVFGGTGADTERLYIALAHHLKSREQMIPEHARISLPVLPQEPPSLSPAAPVSRLKPQLRLMPSLLYKPIKTPEQLTKEKEQRLARSRLLQSNLINTTELFMQEKVRD